MTKFSSGNTRASKLTPEQVLELRHLYHDEGWTQAQLARHFLINVNTVGRIVRNESHQRIQQSEPPDRIAARLFEAQQAADRSVAARLATDIANHPVTKQRKLEEELDGFTDPKALDHYGIPKEE